MFNKTSLVLILCFCTSHAIAKTDAKEKSESNFLVGAILFEVLAGANSWMASESPNLYGGAAALLFPLADAGENIGEITYWSSLTAAESIALYNLTADENSYKKSEMFKNNMIAWNMFAVVVLTTGFIENEWLNKDVITFVPENGGGSIALNYKF